MRYLLRLFVYLAIFGFTCSVGYVALLRFVPVTVTPLKLVRLKEEGLRVRSNWVSLDRINPAMMQAVIATEDNNFLSHRGFDWKAIRQVRKENRAGKRRRGGSSISQQTAKNVFCIPSDTWFRKGVEAYFTVLIEALWGKRRIMEVYLNVVELGPNLYGVEAAARKIYNKSAANLNPFEASMMATVLPNPRRMLLERPSAYMTNRAAQVRRLMAKVPPVDFSSK